jgi:beta-mannosidase
VTVATLIDTNGKCIAQEFYFPNGGSHAQEADIGLEARAVMRGDTVLLTVSTQRFAQYVYFELPGFRAEQEYFHMEPQSELQVILHSNGRYESLVGTVHAVNAVKSARVVVTVSNTEGVQAC